MNLNTSKSRYPICFSGAWYTVNQPNVLGRSFISPLQRILKKMLVAPESVSSKKPHPSAKVLTREEVLTGSNKTFYGMVLWVNPPNRRMSAWRSKWGLAWRRHLKKKKKKKNDLSKKRLQKFVYTLWLLQSSGSGKRYRAACVDLAERTALVMIWIPIKCRNIKRAKKTTQRAEILPATKIVIVNLQAFH